MKQPKSQPDEHSLDWLAFRYISDELSADERTAFESRLESDQLAREAVAIAVELSLALQVAFAEDEVRLAERETLKAQPSQNGWYRVALAAGGLLALVVMNQVVWQAGQPASGDRQLAIAWSETRSQFPVSGADELIGDEEVAETKVVDATEAEGNEAEVDGESVPTWMLAAVSAATSNMSETDQGDAIPE